MSFKLIQQNTLNRLNVFKLDGILVIALILGLGFSLYGIHWGGLEGGWNQDQMALRSLFSKGLLHPYSFQKPPFHTYLNFFLAVVPAIIISKVFRLSPSFAIYLKVLFSRILTVFLFLGAITLVFYITKRFFGLFSARIVTIVFATSASFIINTHFLTADIPLVFWMLVAFYFAQNIAFEGKTSDYVWAGFFTGIATATKYNGLAIGIAIVVSHILSFSSISWRNLILSKKLFLSLLMVPVAFLVGNPYALLNYPTFISDYMYNYIVAPVYSGNTNSTRGYLIFFLNIVEIIGYPSLLVFTIAFVFSIYFVFTVKDRRPEKQGVLLLFSVFLLYYWKFGSFSRLPVRFVLPIMPFYLMISGPFWNKIKPNRIVVVGLLAILLSYNLVSSFYAGRRFAEDPRMLAQEWVKENIPEGSSIESDLYTPQWNREPGINLEDLRVPQITGRRRIFEKLFPPDSWIMREVQRREKEEGVDQTWYSLEGLKKRNSDYIAANSIQYARFLKTQYATLYPNIKKFYVELLGEKYGYKIVFSRATPSTPKWLYPHQITDALENRMTILKRVNSG